MDTINLPLQLSQGPSFVYPPSFSHSIPHDHEKEALIAKIIKLTHQNVALKEKNECLQATVGDLRYLVKLTGQESLTEQREIARVNKKLQARSLELQEKISSSHKNSSHLSKVSLFWREFLD